MDLMRNAIDKGRYSGEDLKYAIALLAHLTKERNRLAELALRDELERQAFERATKTAQFDLDELKRDFKRVAESRDVYQERFLDKSLSWDDRWEALLQRDKQIEKIDEILSFFPNAIQKLAVVMAGPDPGLADASRNYTDIMKEQFDIFPGSAGSQWKVKLSPFQRGLDFARGVSSGFMKIPETKWAPTYTP